MDGHEHLAAEWRRLDLLGRLALASRQGQEPSPEVLSELRTLQEEVAALRANGSALLRVTRQPLSAIEQDLIVCAVAAEVEPRLAWMFQTLQLGGSQPYPTPALLLELLALDTQLAGEMYAALAEGAPLRRGGLIDTEDGGPFQPLRPAKGITARLLGHALPDPSPPGSKSIVIG